MGDDFSSHGLDANRAVLDIFLEAHHAQGLSSRRLAPEELFHPALKVEQARCSTPMRFA
jgi:4,5-dihydroxyphthalate decarboxylase